MPLTISQNITEIKKISHDLSAMETRRKIALQNAEIGIWEWNIITNKVWWDETMFHIFGLDKNTFIPTYQSFSKLIHPDDIKHIDIMSTEAKYHIGSSRYTTSFRIRRNNEWCWVLVIGKKIYNNMGEIVKIIGTNQIIEKNIRLSD